MLEIQEHTIDHIMRGFNFSTYDPNENAQSNFEKLLDLFMQLLTYTNGDFPEAMQWLNELDKEYKLTNNDYGIGDFLEEPYRVFDLLQSVTKCCYQLYSTP